MRTTIDIDAPVLRDLKRLGKSERKTLGQVASEILASGLAARKRGEKRPGAGWRWISRGMGAQVDLLDKDAVYAALGEGRGRAR